LISGQKIQGKWKEPDSWRIQRMFKRAESEETKNDKEEWESVLRGP
jgi:hypothetical protein